MNVGNGILMSSAKKEKLTIVKKGMVYKGSTMASCGGTSLNHPAIDRLCNTPPQNEESEKKRGSGRRGKRK